MDVRWCRRWRKPISGRGNGLCKGPGVAKAATNQRSRKEASEAGKERREGYEDEGGAGM